MSEIVTSTHCTDLESKVLQHAGTVLSWTRAGAYLLWGRVFTHCPVALLLVASIHCGQTRAQK